MRGSSFLFVAALGLALAASAVRADQVIFTLDTNVGSFGSGSPPDPNGPWATATFTQVDDHTVTLDLHALAALGTSFISTWGFNSTDPASDLVFSTDVPTFVKVAGILAPDTFYEPPFTPVYTFGFTFFDSTFMINPPFYFYPYYLPEDPTFTITSLVNPISAATFNTTGDTSPFVTEALIKDINGGVWGASTGAGVGAGTGVPAPSSAVAGLVLMCGLGLWKVIKRKNQEQ